MGECLGVEGDQGGDVRAVVADDQDLADRGAAAQAVLQDGRGDVLAAVGDEDVLLAAGDGEIAVLVERAQVTGREPVVLQYGVGGRRVVPVGAEDHPAPDEHLAVVGDADRGAGDRQADRAGARAQGRDDGGGGGRLGEAVALVDDDSGGREEEVEVAVERGAAADGVPHAAAEFLADTAVHQQVVEGPRGVEGGAGALAGAEELVEVGRAEADRDAVGAVEGRGAAQLLGGGAAGGVDLLEEVRDADEERGPELL